MLRPGLKLDRFYNRSIVFERKLIGFSYNRGQLLIDLFSGQLKIYNYSWLCSRQLVTTYFI